jgi:hypothetical protein
MMVRRIPGGCTLSVRVHPGARRNAITGAHGDALKVSVISPPSEDRANAALIAFLAKRLGIPRRSIELITGAASRTKTVSIIGITAAEAEARLLSDLA